MTTIFKAKSAQMDSYVYECLRDEIYRLDIAPGKQLLIKETAQRLHIPPGKVRNAFHQLEAEGILKPISHGYQVVEFDETYIRQIFSVRCALETAALRSWD